MGKDKFKKRKERKRLIRAELLRRNILVRDIAAGLGISMVAVYKGMMTGSARVTAALIEAGVPMRLLKQIPAPQPKGGHTGPPLQEANYIDDRSLVSG